MDLDPRLAATSVSLTPLRLCDLRLQNDARFPWLVLVPQCDDAADLDDLTEPELQNLIQDVADASSALKRACARLGRPCDKVNVGAIGNIVRQLHVHIVARHHADPAWPHPVWGWGQPQPYDADDLGRTADGVMSALLDPPAR